MEENNSKSIEINLDAEIGKGVYANLALITHSSSEFILDFATMLPALKKANVGARVIMVPEHAKRLLMALQENVFKYEQQFGKIQIPGMPGGRTVSPFDGGRGGKGEA